MSRVAIAQADPQNVSPAVTRVLELSGCLARFTLGLKVVVKPNLITDNPDYIARGANTSVPVLGSLLSLLADARCQVTVGESEVGTHVQGRRLAQAVRYMDLDNLCRRYGATFANFTEDQKVRVPVDGLHFRSFELSYRQAEAELVITIPKIKTHKYATMTCSLKNMYGMIPEGRRVIYHRWLSQAICDINTVFAGRLVTLVDGMIAMEGNGPVYGTPVAMNMVLSSQDLVAADTTCARLIGLDPQAIEHLQLIEKRGLGSSRDIELVGDDVVLPWRIFRPAHLNAYRRLEHRLMCSPLVHILVSEGFQRHVSSHLRPLTRRLRGGSFSWYLNKQDS
ncbi:MAG TPA: DUF362 domain-containing protein [Ktedonobacteraceae bacterium]|nr:DUF362 domain-containing protein [Ktedonobacteraceae bacterium]